MKKSKNLLVLFLVMAVLFSLYLFLKYRPQGKTEDAKVPSKTITLVNLDNESINKIVLKSSNNTLRFEKKNQLWTANFSFPLNQSEVKNLSFVFFGLHAEQMVAKSPSDLEQYGLKDPAVTVEVTVENDKNPKIMYLGDLTPSNTSYYFKLDGDPAVYTIADYNGEKFKLTPTDFRDNSLAQIQKEEIRYFKLSRAGKPDLEVRLNAANSEFAQYGIGIWQMTRPYQEPMSVITDKFQQILESITSITSAEKFIDENPTDLNRYGLAKPQAEVLIKDNRSQFHLLIGNPMNQDSFYCKKPDSKAVFTLSSDDLYFLDTKPFDLVEKFAFIVNIDNVDKIILSGLGSNHTMAIARKIEKSTTKDFEANYQIDGKKVDEQSFKTIYQSLIGLTVESECPIKPKNSVQELRMTFYLNKGSQREIHVDYVPYDYDFYAVFRGGKAEFLISKDQVKTMIRELDGLIKEKK